MCRDALSSLWDLGKGVIDGGDVRDDGLLIWRGHVHVWKSTARVQQCQKISILNATQTRAISDNIILYPFSSTTWHKEGDTKCSFSEGCLGNYWLCNKASRVNVRIHINHSSNYISFMGQKIPPKVNKKLKKQVTSRGRVTTEREYQPWSTPGGWG